MFYHEIENYFIYKDEKFYYYADILMLKYTKGKCSHESTWHNVLCQEIFII